ncbi:MAG: HAD family hydrolase [Gemmatimonadota bacterium]
MADTAAQQLRQAVFLDRDGTLVEERHYLSDPAQVVLVVGAAQAVRRLQGAGLAVVVVTNQSGIARGYYTEAEYRAVADRVDELLHAEGVVVDGTYHCPHLPGVTGPCDCRKPGPGMYLQAARELGLATRGSFYVGDRWKDVLPAVRFGGRGILVRSGYGREQEPLVPEELEGCVAPLHAHGEVMVPALHGPGHPNSRSPKVVVADDLTQASRWIVSASIDGVR